MLEPDGLDGIGEDAVGLIDPDGGRITAQYSVGRSPVRSRPAPARCGSPTGSTARSRGSTATARSDDRRRRRARRARVRRRLAVGGGRRRARGRAGRSGLEQGRARITVGNAPRALALARGRAVGGLRRRRATSTAIDLERRARGARDPARREGDARSPPAPARCGWRARRPAPSPASTRAAGASSTRSRRQRAERRSRWAKARSGSPTAPTGRSRASIRGGTR